MKCSEFLGQLNRDKNISSKFDNGNYLTNIRNEIAKIFYDYLQKHSGLITVIDAFIKYNTMRGSDYVTAKEFIEAVKTVNVVQNDLKVESLENGVMIIRLGDFIRQLLRTKEV